MGGQHLATYLNDHLAGAVVALEILAHLEHAGHDPALAATIGAVRADIDADRAVLEGLMGRLGVGTTGARQAMAWLGEKVAQLKLKLDDSADGSFRLFESLEAVSLGIEGKRGLWRTLAAVAALDPALGALDYPNLIARAETQRQQVEAMRLAVAPSALAA